MKRYLVVAISLFLLAIALIMALMFVFADTAEAQSDQFGGYRDMTPIRPATELFCSMVRGQNVAVHATYQNRTNYRADWQNNTLVTLSGGCYFWWGDLRLNSSQAVVLNGCRGPNLSSGLDADGSIPEHDQCYYRWLPVWEQRPEVLLSDLVHDNPAFGKLWVNAIKYSGINVDNREIQQIFLDMGLRKDGSPYQAAGLSPLLLGALGTVLVVGGLLAVKRRQPNPAGEITWK